MVSRAVHYNIDYAATQNSQHWRDWIVVVVNKGMFVWEVGIVVVRISNNKDIGISALLAPWYRVVTLQAHKGLLQEIFTSLLQQASGATAFYLQCNLM